MKILASVVLSLFSLAVLAQSAPIRTYIADVTIISPENLSHIEKGSVLIENDRITLIDHNSKAKPPAGATILSGKGKFLIPGLIDSHVHLASPPGINFDQPEYRSEMVRQYFKQLPRSYLYYGYTTVIDLAVFDTDEIAHFRQAPLHPDEYDCGPSLPVANGYPMSFVPSPLRFQVFPNFIYDPAQASTIPPEYKPQDHTPTANVARVKASGGICVKTYFERGFGKDRNLPVMSPEVLSQVRQAATQNNLVLMMHANNFEAQKFAADGNVDVIAHGMWNWGDLDRHPDLPPQIKQVLDEIVARKIGYQSTIQVLFGLSAYFDPDYLKSPAIPKVIPKEMLDWFNSPQGKWFKKEVWGEDAPDADVLAAMDRGLFRRIRQVDTYLAGKNAKFLFGTDTPSAPTYGNLPGLNGYLEMQQLQKAGLSLTQIFQAATLSNAHEFKLDSQVGTIEPGKVANLVLLNKSPLESIDAYDTIDTIWIHGRQVSRDTLSADSSH